MFHDGDDKVDDDPVIDIVKDNISQCYWLLISITFFFVAALL